MNVQVFLCAQDAQTADLSGKTAVVIDVLRATSVIPTALHRGAKAIVPVVSPEDAFNYRDNHKEQNVLLAGERETKLIDGFNLDNSPHSFSPQIVKDRTIVMTTSNGTLALNAASKAKVTYVVSFVNIQNSLKKILSAKEDIVIICSGTLGNFSLEDGICAGYIIDRLVEEGNYKVNDLAMALRLTYLAVKDDIKKVIYKSDHSTQLIKNGFGADLDFCFDIANDFEAVVYDGHEAVICPDDES